MSMNENATKCFTSLPMGEILLDAPICVEQGTSYRTAESSFRISNVRVGGRKERERERERERGQSNYVVEDARVINVFQFHFIQAPKWIVGCRNKN